MNNQTTFPRTAERDELLSTAEIAALMKVSPRLVRDRYTHLPGFPGARKMPPGATGRCLRRWWRSEVISWIERGCPHV